MYATVQNTPQLVIPHIIWCLDVFPAYLLIWSYQHVPAPLKHSRNRAMLKLGKTKLKKLTNLLFNPLIKEKQKMLSQEMLNDHEREKERERGGTGKMRSYSEEKIYIIVSIDNDPVVYKIRPEHDPKSKTRTVHPNMLRHCDNLLDNFDWNIREPVYQKHPVTADRKFRKTSEKIQDQSQQSQ